MPGELSDGGPGVAVGASVALGAGEAGAAFTNGNFNAVKSGLLTTKVPSRPSTLANHIASLFRFPIVSLCNVLSSAELVKVITSCGFSKPCSGLVAPTQRTARNEARVLRSD